MPREALAQLIRILSYCYYYGKGKGVQTDYIIPFYEFHQLYTVYKL